MNVPTEISPPPSKINLMFLIWSLEMGGAEHVVLNLVRGVDRARFNPMVCCLNWKGRMAAGLEQEGIPVFSLDKRPKFDPWMLVKMVRLFRRERVHLLNSHLWSAHFWGRLAAILAGVPAIVITEHNLDTWRNRAHFMADQILSKWTDKVIFVSEEVKNFYGKHLTLPAEKLQVVHNGIKIAKTTTSQSEIRKKMGVPEGSCIIGTVGRLDKRKGLRFLLDVVASLVQKNANIFCLIVGEGKEKDDLVQYRDSLGLQDKVKFLGYWPELAEVLSCMDIFTLSSIMEGLPLAILEAMSAGKPVVATDVGGNWEAVASGKTGWLVPYGDIPAMVSALSTLIENPKRAEEMGDAGFARIQTEFSLDAMIQTTQNIYLQCDKEKRS